MRKRRKAAFAILMVVVLAGRLYAQDRLTLEGSKFFYNYQTEVDAFTPVVSSDVFDTINVFEYSSAMSKLGSENLYLKPTDYDVIRLSCFTSREATIITINIIEDKSSMSIVSCYGSDFHVIEMSKSEVKVQLSTVQTMKIVEDLKKSGFWSLGKPYARPCEYIFESVQDGEYYFAYQSEIDLKYNRQNKGLLRAFKKLEKLSR